MPQENPFTPTLTIPHVAPATNPPPSVLTENLLDVCEDCMTNPCTCPTIADTAIADTSNEEPCVEELEAAVEEVEPKKKVVELVYKYKCHHCKGDAEFRYKIGQAVLPDNAKIMHDKKKCGWEMTIGEIKKTCKPFEVTILR